MSAYLYKIKYKSYAKNIIASSSDNVLYLS